MMKTTLALLALTILSSSKAAEFQFQIEKPILIEERKLTDWHGGDSFIAFKKGNIVGIYDLPGIPSDEPLETFKFYSQEEYCLIQAKTARFHYNSLKKNSILYDRIQSFFIPKSPLYLKLIGESQTAISPDGIGFTELYFEFKNKIELFPESGKILHPDSDQEPLLASMKCGIKLDKNSPIYTEELINRSILKSLGKYIQYN